jgi:hypothetical protein
VRAKSTGRSEASAQAAFRRDLQKDWVRSFRAEHRSKLALQSELELAAKQERRRQLPRARRKAESDLAKVKHRNTRRRARIRTKANTTISAAQQARRDERRFYRDYWATERSQRRKDRSVRKGRARPKSEIDSRTEYNIEPDLVAFFRTVKSRYPYSWTPDRRAEKFAEDMEDELADELSAWWATTELQSDWAAAELSHYGAA